VVPEPNGAMLRQYIKEIPSKRSLNSLDNGPSDRLQPEPHYECPMNLLLRSRVMIGIMACILVIVSLIFYFIFRGVTKRLPRLTQKFFIRSFFSYCFPARQKKLSDGKVPFDRDLYPLLVVPQYSCLQSHI
jgi:hypothetical protein